MIIKVLNGLLAENECITDASQLILPMYTQGVQRLFQNCINLENAPKINTSPASIDYYQEIFWGCTSLKSINLYFDTCYNDDGFFTQQFYNWLPNHKGTIYIHNSALFEQITNDSKALNALNPYNWEIIYEPQIQYIK